MELCLTYDMRAPAFGAQRTDLYACALDQVSWADALGVDVVGLGEHHCAQDGYNPSPLVLASAMAARSKRTDVPVLASARRLAPSGSFTFQRPLMNVTPMASPSGMFSMWAT